MEIFDNAEYPNYEQVAEMGPEWWTEFREMDANYQYAGWTLDLAAHFLEMLINNEFPEHCDEDTLRKLENLLQVDLWPGETMDERRKAVSAYLAGNGKLNKSAINSISQLYAGQDADVRWENETLIIGLVNTQAVRDSLATLESIFRRRMPAHLGFLISCVRRYTDYDGVYTHGAMASYTHYQLREEGIISE